NTSSFNLFPLSRHTNSSQISRHAISLSPVPLSLTPELSISSRTSLTLPPLSCSPSGLFSSRILSLVALSRRTSRTEYGEEA
ncbi:unnamed protein product, partial [Brassica oleracea var. botrytis]